MLRFSPSATHPLSVWVVEWPGWTHWADRRRHWLSAEEQQRLASYRKEAAAGRFLVHRVLARRLLAHLLGMPPQDVPLRTDAHGKPFLESHPHIAMSFSHSGPWLAVALGCGDVHLGIDVERVLPDFDFRPIAEAYFHPEVRARLKRPEDFFRAWTLREAVAKALGTGITDELLAKKDEELLPPRAQVHYEQVEDCLICVVWWMREGETERRRDGVME